MKKIMKKIGAVALSLSLALCTASTAFAEQVTEQDGEKSIPVQYYVSGTYIIDIPAYIDVTHSASFYSPEMNIADDAYISIALQRVPENGIYTLTHKSSSDTIKIKFTNNSGEITASGQELARLDNTSNMSTQFNATLINEDGSKLKAGAYQGNVIFYFVLNENHF